MGVKFKVFNFQRRSHLMTIIWTDRPFLHSWAPWLGYAIGVTARGTACEKWRDMEKEQREVIADGKNVELG